MDSATFHLPPSDDAPFSDAPGPDNIGLSLVMDPAARDDVDAIAQTVDSVLELCCLGRFDQLDFSRLDPAACHPVHLAAALRASSYFCDKLPSWRSALGVARAACLARGIDPDDALFGMS